MRDQQRRSLFLLLGCVLAMLLGACSRIDTPAREGALLIAALPEPSALHMPDGHPTKGFAYDFLEGYAKELNVPIRLTTVESFEELEILVREGRVHFGAFLNSNPPRPGLVLSRPLTSMPLWLVQHEDSVGPHSLADLAGREVHVTAGSPAAEALLALPKEQQPQITEVHEISQQDLLQMLANRQITLAAVDELNMRVAANFQPELQPVVQLFGKREFAVAFPERFEAELHASIDDYIERSLASGSLPRLYDSYYGHIQRITPALADRFLSDVRTVLPKYREHFQRAQERTGLDWRLLAALAYQESKWDPGATSYTNVRGIMMLTEETADAVNVENRLDPWQSIRGGADYLIYLMDQLPATVVAPDRLWLALAAYNLGMGHLNGGRAIAKAKNKDPDLWFELKTVLPLMMRPEYYERLKSGRARGGEAVILVENVRNLYGMLTRLQPSYTAPLAQSLPEAKPNAGGLGFKAQPFTFKRSSPPT